MTLTVNKEQMLEDLIGLVEGQDPTLAQKMKDHPDEAMQILQEKVTSNWNHRPK